jgi:uncharacterized protein YbcI
VSGHAPHEHRPAAPAPADVVLAGIVTLEDTFTPAERKLVSLGEHQRLRDMRMVFVREFCEPVERLTGRKVRAFTSGIDTMVEGLSVETFVLHPAGYDGPSRTAAAD